MTRGTGIEGDARHDHRDDRHEHPGTDARGVTAQTIGGLAVTFSPPSGLVELIFGADRILTY